MLPASQSACVTVEVVAIATEARTRLPITAMTATRAESRFVMQIPPGVGACTYRWGPYAFACRPAIAAVGAGRNRATRRRAIRHASAFPTGPRGGGTVYRTVDGVGFWRANGGPRMGQGRKSPHEGNQFGRTPRDGHGRRVHRSRHGPDRLREQRRWLVERVDGPGRRGAVLAGGPRRPRSQAEE